MSDTPEPVPTPSDADLERAVRADRLHYQSCGHGVGRPPTEAA